LQELKNGGMISEPAAVIPLILINSRRLKSIMLKF